MQNFCYHPHPTNLQLVQEGIPENECVDNICERNNWVDRVLGLFPSEPVGPVTLGYIVIWFDLLELTQNKEGVDLFGRRCYYYLYGLEKNK